jgi:hypothetical protein
MIQQALGVENAASVEAVLASGDPNAVLKLREADLQFKQFMREAEIKEEQLVVQDRADARGMAKALGSTRVQAAIVMVLTAMVGWALYELFLEAPPKGSENVLFLVLGQLTTLWGAAIAFFVGTTKGSGDKTAGLMQMSNK